ncbi:MAG: methyltransferase domain-containing protein [Gemmatimonadaceae bacterium]|nr:methyltransferase domain-containing protein [Gemmatimonadaceae bacterium]
MPDAGPLPLSDAQVLAAWHTNADPWSVAVRGGLIESRRLVTDRAVLAEVERWSPRTALDIGCGEGWLSRAMAQRGIRVTGVDAVPALVEAARHADAAGDYRVMTYEALAGGAMDGPPGVAFDLAVANFSLIGGDAVEALIRHIPALLVPHGALIVQTLHPATARGEHPYMDAWREGSWAGFSADFRDPPPWYYRTMGSWIRLLVHSGFQVQDVIEPLHPATGSPASVLFVVARA